MLNQVTIIGRIANDLEPILVGETMVVRFNLAVNLDKDKADFFPIECWDKIALNLLDYAAKGTEVLISGYLKQDRFTDKNGNKKSKIKVKAKYIRIGFAPNKENTAE